MKILQVVHGFPPTSQGGTELYVSGLVKALKRDHEVIVFFAISNYARTNHRPTNGIIAVPAQYNINAYSRFPIHSPKSIKCRQINWLFSKTLNEHKPDVIHFQHTGRLPLSLLDTARMHKVPYVVTLHDFWFLCPRIHFYHADDTICETSQKGSKCISCIRIGAQQDTGLKEIISSTLTTSCFRDSLYKYRYHYSLDLLQKANMLIAPSRFVKRKFVSEGLEKNKAIVLPLGIAQMKVKRRIVKKRKMQFGYIGAIKKHKGVSDLINAFTLVNPNRAQLNIYGGSVRSIKLLDVSKYDHIKFHGTFVFTQRSEIYKKMDVLVIPSRCYETYSFVAREAMLNHIPVIAPNHSVFPEIIKNKRSGFLYRPLNVHSLVEKIDLMLQQPLKVEESVLPFLPTMEEHRQSLMTIYKEFLHGA